MANSILRIDASARTQGSITRSLTDDVIAKLGGTNVVTRDLAESLPQISEAWLGANWTAADERDEDQKAALALSDALIAEVKAAETLVIGVPVYNFGVPAALKAWVDLICRAGLTFSYSESGPKGLLEGKRAILIAASGGTKIGSEIDFAVSYMRHIMGFIGINAVEVVSADQMALDADASMAAAKEAVAALVA